MINQVDSTMRHYCTYFDANYLPTGLALIRSLVSHETAPWKIHVICLDEITRLVLQKIGIPQVHCVSLHLLEKGDGSLLKAKRNRSTVEYYWTLTPTIVLRIFDWYPQIEELTYLDADLFFFSNPKPIFDEFSGFSVLIHEHRFPARLQHLETDSGRFNVGLLCFRRDERGLKVLHRWRDQCNSWCYARAEGGKYGDQAYLNAWPTDFEGVGILENAGAGLAPWNYEQYSLVLPPIGSSVPPTVNGRPIVFYHFHAFATPFIDVYAPLKLGTVYFLTPNILLGCYWPYIIALSEQYQILARYGISRGKAMVEGSVQDERTTCLVPSSFSGQYGLNADYEVRFELPLGWTCVISKKQPLVSV